MKRVQVVLRLAPEEHERAVRHRKKTGISTTHLMRTLLREHFDAVERESRERRGGPRRSA